MKRQSNTGGATHVVVQGGGKNEGGRKKSKRTEAVVESKEILDGIGKKKKNNNNEGDQVAVFKLENLLGWEEWPWLSGVPDEQMSWGSVWSPFWDVDYVDKAYNVLFSDVAWDDDIWNLKTITEIPKAAEN